jgi:hypothetical protein
MECCHYKGGRRVWCPPGCPWQGDPRPRSWRARRRWLHAHREEDGRFGLDEGFHTLEELWIPEIEHWLRAHDSGLPTPASGSPSRSLPLEARTAGPGSSWSLRSSAHRRLPRPGAGSSELAGAATRRTARGRRVLAPAVATVAAVGLAVSSLVIGAAGPTRATGTLAASSSVPAASRTVRTEAARSVRSAHAPGARAPGHCPGAHLHSKEWVAPRGRVHLLPVVRPVNRLSLATTRSRHRPCELAGLRHQRRSGAVS